MKKLAVIAIGGNSLIRDKHHLKVEDQYREVTKTVKHIVEIINKGYDVVITHGNGPQVGFVLRRSEIAYEHEGLHFVPLQTCVANTQGAIGYQIQQALDNELRRQKIKKQAVTVVTQTKVDKDDPGFKNSTKPIGQFYNDKKAEEIRNDHPDWQMVSDAGRGWRRVVPSPKPVEIIEMNMIENLIDNQFCVVATGGGGIPVIENEDGSLEGVAAVIDKDFASAMLARNLKAELLIISTGVDRVCLNYGSDQEEPLSKITADEAYDHMMEGHFETGSMLPKIEAILWFLEQGGKKAIITKPENLRRSLQGKCGTHIVQSRPLPEAVFMIGLKLNGEEKIFTGNKDMPLLHWLRAEQQITSHKDGCSGQGACGACLVEINGRAALACRTQMKKLAGADVVTIEGFEPELKDLLAKAFVKSGAVQCGFCTPGFLTRAKILLQQVELPSDTEIKKVLGANLCRCTGYAKIIEAVMLAAKSRFEGKSIKLLQSGGVGENQAKHDAYLTALGQRKFVGDMVFESMTYGTLKFSEHPRARVLAIHTEKAKNLPGVIRVFTAEDIPGDRMTGVIHKDWPVMVKAGEITRYIGDVLAGVVAEDEITAWRACKLITVDYDVLEPVIDPFKALENKIKVHEKGNLLSETAFTRGGDVHEAFNKSAYVVAGQYKTQLVEHGFLETEACIAKPLEHQSIQIFTQSQGIYEDRHSISCILGLPQEKVVATLVPCGGAFGGKEDLTVQGHAALYAFLLNRPVKVSLTRDESIRMHVKRHPFTMDYKLGCDERGKLTALSARIVGDTGAYASLGGEVLNRAAGHASGGYHVPVVDVNSKAVYTNNLPAGAMRGFGVNQVTFAMECMVDELCEKAKIDPWQFRYDNALEKGKMTATGQVLGDGVGLKKTLMALKKDYDKEKYKGLALGIKNIGFGNGLIDESEVKIQVLSGSEVVIHHGWTEMGQGVDTIARQVFNEMFDFPDLEIKVVSSTDSEAIGGTTTASRGTFLMGNSLIVAAEKMKKALGSNKLGNLAGQSFKGRWFCDWTNKPGKDVEQPVTHFAYGYAAQLVILGDDGSVKRVVAAHDAGKVINPKLFEGQIEGAVMMGLGYAFKEKLELENGYLKTTRMMKLGMPRVKDMPEIEVIAVEETDPKGPFGAKGVGEIGLVPTAPAAINALYQFDKKRRYQLPINRKIK